MSRSCSKANQSLLNSSLTNGMDNGTVFKAFEFSTFHPLDWDGSQLELFESGEEWQSGAGIIIWKWEVGGLKCLEMYKERQNRNWLRNIFAITINVVRIQNTVSLWLKKGDGRDAKQVHMGKENCSFGNMIQ
jgi:hypothetical protein